MHPRHVRLVPGCVQISWPGNTPRLLPPLIHRSLQSYTLPGVMVLRLRGLGWCLDHQPGWVCCLSGGHLGARRGLLFRRDWAQTWTKVDVPSIMLEMCNCLLDCLLD